MNTVPRTPSDHYAEAERLLGAAESSRTFELQLADAVVALAHATLAAAPRRARRRPALLPGRTAGGSPRQRWVSGEDDETTP